MTKMCRRSAGVAVLVAAAAIGLAACGGGSSTPQVASLGNSNGDSSGTPASTASGGTSAATGSGDPTQLLNEWTACMRGHGDPNQADPTIDAGKAIHVAEPAGYYGTIDGPTGQNSSGAGVICQKYLTAASTALRGGQPLPQPDAAQQLKFSECMRANGISNFPDPGSNGGPGSSTAGGAPPNPNSPTFQKASKLCGQKTGVPGFGSTIPGEIRIYLSNGQLGLVSF